MSLRRPRGFTLIELTVASALFLIFIALTSLEVASVSRLSRRIAHGSGELIAASRLAEQFRDDVRQAQTANVSAIGDAVELALADGNVIYRLSTDQQVERVVVKSGEISTGPRAQKTFYALENVSTEALRRPVLHARWDCFAENDPRQDPSDPARPDPLILVLDTALRAETQEASK